MTKRVPGKGTQKPQICHFLNLESDGSGEGRDDWLGHKLDEKAQVQQAHHKLNQAAHKPKCHGLAKRKNGED
jgi:hypothetical protein